MTGAATPRTDHVFAAEGCPALPTTVPTKDEPEWLDADMTPTIWPRY